MFFYDKTVKYKRHKQKCKGRVAIFFGIIGWTLPKIELLKNKLFYRESVLASLLVTIEIHLLLMAIFIHRTSFYNNLFEQTAPF